MPIELGIWRIDGELTPVQFSPLPMESRLEDALYANVGILDPGLMIVGRQIGTAYGTFIDLLAIDAQGDLVVIELKRDRTPRDVVAQVLDYGSWVEGLNYQQVTALFAGHNGGRDFEGAFAEHFKADPPETLNGNHRLVIVASSLDAGTERIIGYLADTYSVPVNAVFFRYFQENGHEYIARTWLIDPDEAEAQVSRARVPSQKKEAWNGSDFYVSIGEGDHRTWADCQRYGFVSAGQGRWYSQSLNALKPGHRVFACIPKTGYVGVGVVTDGAKPVRDVIVEVDGKPTPLLDAPLQAPLMHANADDPDLSEYVVRVDWTETRPTDGAIWATGMFANQNSACRLRNHFTLERLVDAFGLDS